ncbi:unnamed protein product, partial [Brassica napus]
GFPASRVISLDPVRQQSTSSGRVLPGLDRTQYRFGVQKRQGSFRMGRESNPDGGCHHRPRPATWTTSSGCQLFIFIQKQKLNIMDL